MTINYESTKKSIGKAIQYWRLIEGFKQREMSEKFETNRAYISKLEGGYVGISIKKINKMANILGISYFTLLRGLPSEKALEIINDMHHDIELKLSKKEYEALWCLNISDVTYKKYHDFLCVLRDA